MRKIGLVSVHNPNYGSMLQTYALHTYLKSLGVDNEIILYTKKRIGGNLCVCSTFLLSL